MTTDSTNTTDADRRDVSDFGDQLGPLPKPLVCGCDDNEQPVGYYTAEQMISERQRCYLLGSGVRHRCSAAHLCDCQEAGQACQRSEPVRVTEQLRNMQLLDPMA